MFMTVIPTNSNNAHSPHYPNMQHAIRYYWRKVLKTAFLFSSIGDADDIGIPKTNTWYFNGYDTDECFDKYFEDPTEHKPPTCYLGFPCTKVCNIFKTNLNLLKIKLDCAVKLVNLNTLIPLEFFTVMANFELSQ